MNVNAETKLIFFVNGKKAEFITLYREQRALWDVTSKQCSIKHIRNESYYVLVEKTKEVFADADDKFVSESFRRELKKVVESKNKTENSHDKVVENNPDPEWTLLWYLRKKLLLTGSKYGCGEGGCGACTVMLSRYLRDEDSVRHIAVNACLTPVCAVHGMAVTTIEGIGSTESKLHPVQERIAKAHGSQCGFCTPGIVMSMYSLLRAKNDIEYDDIEETLQGNLCRCTGYRPIIEGFKTFTTSRDKLCALGKNCCNNTFISNDNSELYDQSSFRPYDPSQEPIFPPELKMKPDEYEKSLYYKGDFVLWLRPKEFVELLLIRKQYVNSKIVVGNSEIGIEMKFKKQNYPILCSPTLIKELQLFTITEHSIIVGASTTLTDLQKLLKMQISKLGKDKTKILRALVYVLHWFAGNQIRNVACIAGNIVTASPISDLNPILMAARALLNVQSYDRGPKKITMDEKFFKSYRKTSLEPDEIILSIEIPYLKKREYFKAYKQAKRREDDISIVIAAFYVSLEDNSNTVKEARLCYGGMASTTLQMSKTSNEMKGKYWNEDLLNTVFRNLSIEFQLDGSEPGGMPEYRKSLCLSFFFKFYLDVLKELKPFDNERNNDYVTDIDESIKIHPKSSQCFAIHSNKQLTDTVGKPIIHASSFKQVTGEAIYCDDIPPVEGELFLCLLFSKKPHAKIIYIDASKALAMRGVEAFFSAKDLDRECNKMGPIIQDEEIFCSDIVTSRGCVLGAIVAVNENIARKAIELIDVEYEDLFPVIITLEDAIAQKSFFPGYPKTLKKGNIQKAFEEADNRLEGYTRSGAQEHFYLETHSCFAIRKEDEIEIVSSSQSPAEIAHFVSKTLRIPNHKVVAKVKRIGGGFGGKETRASILALPVAIAAYKLKKPVRAVFNRDEDMFCTGHRHPHLIKYEVAFSKIGKILGAKFDIYNNAGNSMDLSCAVNERATTHIDNCYFIPNMEVNGYVCKTNLPSNTAFRGFGAPQVMLGTETMIRHIAETLNKTYEEIARCNMYNEGDLTHFNQNLTHCTIKRCWDECLKNSNYWERKLQIEQFNKLNRWKKKGISVLPTKYGISFQVDVLMQGGALILVYTDGSVLLTIGGIEMGQGLFTKMIQIASKILEIDIKKIHISETATDKVPNSSPTAASISSDLYGMAVLDACNKILKRLKPYKDRNPDGKWENWVESAYVDRVSLSAAGFYSAPKIEYDIEKNSGNLFEYFTYGVACSEVIIDCLSGDHQVLRTDIVMDIGESINPAIDIGQIEGAFIQGYGFYTMEELIYSPEGELHSRGPGTYKIPGFSDIPKEFNVSLLKGAPNPRAVYSSKAVGEPPLFLSASVFFAIKEAISAARADSGATRFFSLDAPATCARIRMACEDDITKQVVSTIHKTDKLWNVTV